MYGPPLYDVVSSRPAGSPSVLSWRPSCFAVACRSTANPSRLPPTVFANAYAASFAETINIEAIIWSIGHGLSTGKPMRIVSTLASCAFAVTSEPGQSRSIEVSAVMIFAVLAGCSALWMLSPTRTCPLPASTRMSAFGDGSPAAAAGPAAAVIEATLMVAASTVAAPDERG